jgi:hypothetical protein
MLARQIRITHKGISSARSVPQIGEDGMIQRAILFGDADDVATLHVKVEKENADCRRSR